MASHEIHIIRTNFADNPALVDSLENLAIVPIPMLYKLTIKECIFSQNRIPPSLQFENLSSLKILTITDCQLVEIPRNIGFLLHLEHLDLTSNNLTTICDEMKNLQNIETIDLNNNLIKVIPKFFGEFPRLTELNMIDNPLTTIPEQLLDKKSKGILNFMFNIDEVDNETLQLIYQYVWTNDGSEHSRDSPMRLEELLDVDEVSEKSPAIKESIIEKLIRQKKTKYVRLKKGDPIVLRPTTQIFDFIEGEIDYSAVPKKNIILFQNENELRTVERDFLLHSTESNSIVYECKEIHKLFYDFTEEQLLDKIPYFRLRTLGFYGVVPLDEIISVIRGKNKIYRIVETPKKLLTVISHNVLYEKGDVVSASHCQDGQEDTVYSIEIVTRKIETTAATDFIAQRTRKRTRENKTPPSLPSVKASNKTKRRKKTTKKLKKLKKQLKNNV
jgi:hypothetical protein